MKRHLSRLMAVAMIIVAAIPARADGLFDTAKPTNLMGVGIRVGLTSGNLSNNFEKGIRNIAWKNQNWRNGYAVGAVVDINILGCFTLQPGCFIYSRNNDYNYLIKSDNELTAVKGKFGCNYIQMPILASLRMGVAELAQLQLDFGPYLQWGFGGKNKFTRYTSGMTQDFEPVIVKTNGKSAYFGDSGLAKRYDYGIKMGVGVLALGHIYAGVHYMYGLRNILNYVPGSNSKLGGHNKAWLFTLGYNL